MKYSGYISIYRLLLSWRKSGQRHEAGSQYSRFCCMFFSDVLKTVLHLNPQLFNLRRYFTNPPEGRELFDWLVFFLSSTKQHVFSLNVESKQHLFYVLTFLLYSMIFSNAEWISLLSVVFSYVGCPWCFVGSLNTVANASKKKTSVNENTTYNWWILQNLIWFSLTIIEWYWLFNV